jgi:hypothetical protein
MPLRCGSGSPFGLAGLWENWKNPATGGVGANLQTSSSGAASIAARVVALSARYALCSSGEEQLHDFGTNAQ